MRDKIIFIGIAVLVIVVGVLVFLFGSENAVRTQPAPVSESRTAEDTVSFTKIKQGNHSMVMGRVNYIVTSPSGLSELWNMVDATGTPPAVDFQKHSVIAVFAGNAPDAKITITKIKDTDTRLVSITLMKTDSSCVRNQPALSPYEIAIVPMTSLPLTHEDIVATTSCK
jgi:hypothetical protein